MPRPMPSISDYMTPLPFTVEKDDPISRPFRLMRDFKFRHLPVVERGKPIGIVTDRGVRAGLSTEEPWDIVVADVMHEEPYSVPPETPLDEVVAHMAANRLDCVLVGQAGGKILGIFTDNDALRVLGGLSGGMPIA